MLIEPAPPTLSRACDEQSDFHGKSRRMKGVLSRVSSELQVTFIWGAYPVSVGAAYFFRSDWTFDANVAEVSAILEDISKLKQWWPAVYLDVQVLEPGNENGVGRVVTLLTKGWLPYLLRWKFTVVSANAPHGFSIAAEGDFKGTGVWTLRQLGEQTHVRFDWTIQAQKPLLRRLSWLLRPLFSANHHWAMERGEESLALELRRRRGELGVPRARTATWPHSGFEDRDATVPEILH